MTPSGAAPGSTSPFGGGPTSVHMDMHLGVESEQRLQVTMTATVPGGHLSGQGVLVSGVLYLSTNGGNSWTSQPSDGSNFQYGPSEALQFMKAVGNVSDAGPGTVDGVSVEDYNATLDPAKMETAAGSVFSELGGGASGNAAVAQLLHSLNGVMRAAIDSAGRLVTEDCTANATLEFPSFGGSSASASGFSIHETVHGHFYDYGAAITVQAPRAARVHASSAPSPGSGSPFATVSSGLGN